MDKDLINIIMELVGSVSSFIGVNNAKNYILRLEKLKQKQVIHYKNCKPDCMKCSLHGRCSVSLGSEYCHHLFYFNQHK